ncbi:pentafunctional arom polypeptide [Ophiostoma piceae UAMH 11346]|uniref:Pentafunctional arom polypeptide n=1 Tax=Ophiostoma piceae (strain UAMH 11346) TaxID=1262450 RepID=S3DAN5_OPHP1|nr:pentafunctional arom polypeptide [Ophiostoma piceae UAMH 11346]
MAAVQQMPPAPRPDLETAIRSAATDLQGGLGDMSDSPRSPPLAAQYSAPEKPVIGNRFGGGPQRGDTRIVVIVFGQGQESIVPVFAEVLGKPFYTRPTFGSITAQDHDRVIGVCAQSAKADISLRDRGLVVAINAHCVTVSKHADEVLSDACDYEFLYTDSPFFRRDLARFISFTLGQTNHHQTLMAKPRTYFISTTFPDVRVALPNIDILTVGSDAVEIRADLLKEPLEDGTFAAVPSLSHVGEQVMTLRQRTELPIIFTTRCQRENGRFPVDNPELFYKYLYKAVQWGVEYIDVELWLPEPIRKRLYEQRGNSRIMSAYHDVAGTFKWSTAEAQDIYAESKRYADIVKMIGTTVDRNENFELEYFRSKVRSEFPDGPPLSAVNMGEAGQFSRTQNHVFSPITHPLLPVIAAPGQMSAAETNAALSMLGQLPKKVVYGIASSSSRTGTPQAPFYVKCFNELGLPHQFAVVEQQPTGPNRVESWCNQKNFGGAYLHPPLPYTSLISKRGLFASLGDGTGPVLTEAARAIGIIDTIVVQPPESTPHSEDSVPSSPYHRQNDHGGSGCLAPNTQLIFDNATWRGILSALTRDLAPSAYLGRTAVVLASSSDDAASTLFALAALGIGKVYTVGFKTPPALAGNFTIEPFNSLESLQRAREVGAHDNSASPFVFVSALAPEKENLVCLLLRVFSSNTARLNAASTAAASSTTTPATSGRKVFLDLAADSGGSSTNLQRTGSLATVAEQSGFAVLGSSDVNAFTTVETLRLLVGQNVPYTFVRLAGGRSPF